MSHAKRTPIHEYVRPLAMALALALFLRALVAEPFSVPTGSMLPTIEIGDHVYVHKLGGDVPEPGQVIVFDYPGDPDRDPLIKRVVGLPGDSIEMRAGALAVNGKEAPRCPVGEITLDNRDIATMTWSRERSFLYLERLGDSIHTIVHDPHALPLSWGPFRVPDGQVFVMGDNRDNSHDSRSWGGVDLDLIIGTAFVIWWSIGPLDRPLRLERMGHLLGSDPLPPEGLGELEESFSACARELAAR